MAIRTIFTGTLDECVDHVAGRLRELDRQREQAISAKKTVQSDQQSSQKPSRQEGIEGIKE